MRLPRPCLTIHQLMISVAIVAVSIELGRMVDRHWRFSREATRLVVQAQQQSTRAAWFRDLAEHTPGRAAEYEGTARSCEQEAADSRKWADLWQAAADHPWQAEPRSGLASN